MLSIHVAGPPTETYNTPRIVDKFGRRRGPSSWRDGGADGDTEAEEAGSTQGGGSASRDGGGPPGVAGMEVMARRVLGPLPPGAVRHDRAGADRLRPGAGLPAAAETVTRPARPRARTSG